MQSRSLPVVLTVSHLSSAVRPPGSPTHSPPSGLLLASSRRLTFSVAWPLSCPPTGVRWPVRTLFGPLPFSPTHSSFHRFGLLLWLRPRFGVRHDGFTALRLRLTICPSGPPLRPYYTLIAHLSFLPTASPYAFG